MRWGTLFSGVGGTDWGIAAAGHQVVWADARATIARSLPVLPDIRALGYRAAFVAQDGLEDLDVPWRDFDVLFIGGSTAWKLSDAAASVVAEAKRQGKGTHMGRVNSLKRLRAATGGLVGDGGTATKFDVVGGRSMTTYDDAHAALAARLRTARERAGLSQSEVARRLGMHRPSITWIESGQRNVLAVELVVFARLYDVGVLWLLGLEGENAA